LHYHGILNTIARAGSRYPGTGPACRLPNRHTYCTPYELIIRVPLFSLQILFPLPGVAMMVVYNISRTLYGFVTGTRKIFEKIPLIIIFFYPFR
jgi:hypothetical protein